MSKIKCLIVDDEPPAIELLESYASRIDQLEVVGTSQNALKAFPLVKETQAELLFLDIRMPVLSGLDFLKTMQRPPATIITTAYRDYAHEGYDLDIIDYLLKPISFERFLRSVDRYLDRRRSNPDATEPDNPLSLDDHIFISINRRHHKLVLKEVLYIESLKDYVRVHTINNKYVVKGNIGTFMKRLPKDRFIRIHRSFGIAIGHIKSFSQIEVEIGDQKIPIGISYRNELHKLLP